MPKAGKMSCGLFFYCKVHSAASPILVTGYQCCYHSWYLRFSV